MTVSAETGAHTSEMQLSTLQSQHCRKKILILLSKYTEGDDSKGTKKYYKHYCKKIS